MSKKKLSELSTEELTKREKQYKFVAGLIIGLVAGMVILGILKTINEGFSISTIAFLPSLIFVFLIWSERHKIQQEINSR